MIEDSQNDPSARETSSLPPLGRFHRIRAGAQRTWRWLSGRLESLKPRGPVRRGVAWGATVPLIVLGLVVGSTLESQFGLVGDLSIGLLLALVLLGVAVLSLHFGRWLVAQLGDFVGVLGLAAGVVFAIVASQFLFSGGLGAAVAILLAVTGGVLGGSAAALRTRGGARVRAVSMIGVVVPLIVVAALVVWLRGRGTLEHLVELEDPTLERVIPLDAPDPAEPGPYEVRSLTYGSGHDRRRTDFREVLVETESVDASVFTQGYEEGWKEKLRDWFWGFSPEAYPINGRVWMPVGEGPYPLVLIVHGNHNMGEFSDPGYGYLGEHLASRGMISVSVDENFLNGSIVGGVPTENDARGWLLLQHLAQWRRWQRDGPAGHPLAGVADLDRIALIGHSRGGEAAAIAAAFNRMSRYPDDATTDFDFGFDIRGVIAIAPSDSQYRPADRPTPVGETSYFTIQGGHDADVSLFLGDRQWNRVEISPEADHFKASLYVYRANHGQFNTVWGDSDLSRPTSWLLNRAPLHDEEDQRTIGKVFMTAFLEVVLHERREYMDIFRDPRRARTWLPDDLYFSRFEDSGFRLVTDYEEDVDVTTSTLDGGRIEAEGLVLWREGDLGLRDDGERLDNAAALGWRPTSVAAGEAESRPPASYTIWLPEGLGQEWQLKRLDRLVFDMAALDEEVPEPDAEGEAGEGSEEDRVDLEAEDAEDNSAEEQDPAPIDLSVVLRLADGRELEMTLADSRLLLPPLPVRFTRLAAMEKRYGSRAEPVLQTFELPLGDFRFRSGEKVGPELDWTSLTAVCFVFDRSEEAVVALDRVGFWSAPAGDQDAVPADEE